MEDKNKYLETIRSDMFLNGLMMSYDQACNSAGGRLVLDYGCGYGWGSYLLSGSARQVMGYDLDRTRIQFARGMFAKRNLTFLTDVIYLPAGSFEMVCLFLVLPWAENPLQVLDQAGNCLVPGGELWLSFKSGDNRLTETAVAWAAGRKAEFLRVGCRRVTDAVYLNELILKIG